MRTLAAGLALATTMILAACSKADAPVPPEPPADVQEALVAERIAELTAAVREEPRSSGAWGRLGTVYDLHRYFDRALACYEQALELDASAWRWHYFSGIVLRESDHAAAARSMKLASGLNPEYAPLQLYLAHSLFLEEDIDGAHDHYSRALEIDPRSVNARIGLAQVALARQDTERAATLLGEAMTLAPQEAAVHHHMAHLLDLTGQAEAAEFRRRVAASAPLAMQPGEMASFVDPVREQATLRDGVSSTWLLANSQVYHAMGRAQDARDALDALLRADPTSITGLLASARLYLAEGNADRAIEQARTAVELAPGEAAAQADLGMALARVNRLPEAITAFRRALEIDPDLVEAANNIATLLFQTGAVDEGLDLLREASRSHPGRIDVQYNLANALLATGKTLEADEVLRRGVSVDPTNAGMHHLRAIAQTMLGRPEEAVSEFRRTVELDPENPDIRSDFALALWQVRRYDEALAQYREAFQRSQGDPVKARDLAWALSVCPRDDVRNGAQALEITTELNRQSNHSDPRFLDALAVAQAETGQFGLATGTADRALKIVQDTLRQLGDRFNAEQRRALLQFQDELRRRRELFSREQPYREGS